MKWLELTNGVVYSVSLLVAGVVAMRSDWPILATSAIFWSGVGATTTYTSFMLHETIKGLEKLESSIGRRVGSDS